LKIYFINESIEKRVELYLKTPIILDTDIGIDIDDTWALGLLLKCPELDIKLISCVSGDTKYRATIVAKFLEKANRANIPIAYNNSPPKRKMPKMQSKWVEDYHLESYPGQIFANAPQAICEMVSKIETPLIIIGVGPLANLAEAIRLDPRICTKARYVGMLGSIYKGYYGSSFLNRDYNVAADVVSSRIVFQAPWPKLITSLDTGWLVVLKGLLYQQLWNSRDPVVLSILENYQIWAKKFMKWNYHKTSTNLFDTVAIYLAIAEDLVEIEELPLIIDDKGYTRINPAGSKVRCALRWKSLDGYFQWLVNRLLS
jgi:inosine-uridine nucleoside N-ribohydrolase